ncbi:MAG: ABC transporter permease [Ktedonobacteraceae bacterium]|nr:ABC transporter permease [Ktedonobacteraceae bacterium]
MFQLNQEQEHKSLLPPQDVQQKHSTAAYLQSKQWAEWLLSQRRLFLTLLPALVCFFLLLLLWQWYTMQPGVDTHLFPPPLFVWTQLVLHRDLLWSHMLVTLYETAVGFAVALVAGMLFATLMDFSSWLRRGLYPLLVMSQTIPFVAIAPLLLLWFGFGLISKIILITLVCFFPITVALADGLGATDPEALKLYRTFGAGPVRIFWSLRLPGAVPTLFSGIRIAVSYSILSAIFSEYIGATAGLGFYIEVNQSAYSTVGVMATTIVIALLTASLFVLTGLVERLVIPWYYLHRRST